MAISEWFRVLLELSLGRGSVRSEAHRGKGPRPPLTRFAKPRGKGLLPGHPQGKPSKGREFDLCSLTRPRKSQIKELGERGSSSRDLSGQ